LCLKTSGVKEKEKKASITENECTYGVNVFSATLGAGTRPWAAPANATKNVRR
jgi:hypothetical protein